MRYVKPGDEAVAEVNSLLGPTSAATDPKAAGPGLTSQMASGDSVLTNAKAVSSAGVKGGHAELTVFGVIRAGIPASSLPGLASRSGASICAIAGNTPGAMRQ
jgi:hypothetical protein